MPVHKFQRLGTKKRRYYNRDMKLFGISLCNMSLQQRTTTTVTKTTDESNEKVADQVTLLKNEVPKLTLTWNEIPAWMQDNVYITAGYRPQSNSYWACIKSLGYLHNESGKVRQFFFLIW